MNRGIASGDKYVIISPVRNEGEHLQQTINSVVSQTILPSEWILVDDGSADNTAQILSAAEKTHSFIRVIKRRDRGFRKSGTGVMEAFYDGFEQLKVFDWKFLVKLDGDLKFDSRYFESILEYSKQNPGIGITGGEILVSENGLTRIECKDDPLFHVRGANKVYRRECWDQINGLIRTSGWDTVDEVNANMCGWRTQRLETVSVIHLRPTGGADGSWRNAVKNGRGSYSSGYHPLFLLAKCAKRLFEKRQIVEPLGLMFGYFQSVCRKEPRHVNIELLRYIQRQQINRLLGRESMWV